MKLYREVKGNEVAVRYAVKSKFIEPADITEDDIIRLRRITDRAISYINQFGKQDKLGFHIIDELAESKAILSKLKS